MGNKPSITVTGKRRTEYSDILKPPPEMPKYFGPGAAFSDESRIHPATGVNIERNPYFSRKNTY